MHIPDNTINKCSKCGSTSSEYFNDGRRKGRRCLNPECRHEALEKQLDESPAGVSRSWGKYESSGNVREF